MSKNYCFTDFKLRDWAEVYQGGHLNYACRGEESCPETKRLHLQGWVQFKVRTRFKLALEQLGGHIALFKCRGTEEQNNKYCSKDNQFMSWGEFTTQGQRADLSEIAERLKDPDIPLESIANDHPGDWMRYYRGMKDFRQMAVKANTTKFRHVETYVFFGETGTGKTRAAKQLGEFLIHGDSMDWWDGYEHEKTIIIDEYACKTPITKLLGLLDGYQCRLPIKGGFTYANWTRVIITTNLDILHDGAKDAHRRALDRRITAWVDFSDCTEVMGNITHHFGTEFKIKTEQENEADEGCTIGAPLLRECVA